MSRNVLISFIGSHDLTKDKNGAVEQLIKYLKPQKTYLFLTEDYKKEFYQNNLQEHYSSLTEELEIIDTDIKNPTDSEEIAKNISDKIEEINNYILENKLGGVLNLTSGTPAILSVLSLFAITGQLNKTTGLYAPNPKYDNEIKRNPLDYYKNSFAYKTIKDMINSCNYIAIEDFITKNKKLIPKLTENKDFRELTAFTLNRAISNYEEAYKIREKSEFLKEYDYKIPENLYEKSIESLMSTKIAQNNKDYFQATLKLGIIRENLVSYLLDEILKRNNLDIVEVRLKDTQKGSRNKDEGIRFLKKEEIEQNCPNLIEYLNNQMQNSSCIDKKIDLNRELTSHLEGKILEYFLNGDDEILNKIQKEFYKLEKLKSERNKTAHTINAPEYEEIWLKSIEKIINYIAQYLGFNKPDLEIYKKINKDLLQILNNAINN